MNKLTLLRRANRYRDRVKSGFVYLHSWPTGWQELIFDNHDDAAKWLVSANSEAS